MKKFRVTYSCHGAVEVEANSVMEALDKFMELPDEEVAKGVKTVDVADVLCGVEDE